MTKKLMGIALLWIGLSAAVYVPGSDGGLTTTILAGAGFLCFGSGLLLFAEGIKQDMPWTNPPQEDDTLSPSS
jgi:hypothetical protein